jgi:hypothetical protein
MKTSIFHHGGVVATALLAFSLNGAWVSPAGASESLYVPPMTGAPKVRVGGGSRGISRGGGDERGRLGVLAPTDLAYSATATPVLYWFMQPGGVEVELIVTEPWSPEPLVTEVIAIDQGGIQGFDMAASGKSLQPGKRYNWSVSRLNEAAEGGEIYGGSALEYHPPETMPGEASPEEVRELAARGYWYEAFDMAYQGAQGNNAGDYASLLE